MLEQSEIPLFTVPSVRAYIFDGKVKFIFMQIFKVMINTKLLEIRQVWEDNDPRVLSQ